MKKYHLLLLLTILPILLLVPEKLEAQAFLVKARLRNLPGVVSIEKIPNDAPFQCKFLIMFEQPIDHSNPAAGTFLQRVFIFHSGFDRPMVITTEGYAAGYAERAGYIDEIADYFNTNQIVVEHRYFGKSVPEGAGWGPLTVENAAADHHRVIEAFKVLYKEKWLSTGISKGGSAVLYHRVLYPEDVDITVPYVAPLNFGVEDGRHESFIATNALPEYRAAINRFQTQVLLRRDSLMPMLEKYVEGNKLTYKIPLDEVYDYLVLEYAFAFYQWGWALSTIPGDEASDAEIFLHFVLVSQPDYFSLESYEGFLPFYVQAAKQLGYYGYEIRPFEDLMHIKTTRGYLKRIFLPDSLSFEFSVAMSEKAQQFLFTKDPKMIFLYGEWDPWTASSVIFDAREKENMLKIVKPHGSHSTRIGNLPPETKKLVLDRLGEWLF